MAEQDGDGAVVGYVRPGGEDLSGTNEGSEGGSKLLTSGGAEVDVSSLSDDEVVSLAEDQGFDFTAEGATREELERFLKGEKDDEDEDDEKDIPEEAKLQKVSKELEAERKELQRQVAQKMQGVAGLRLKAQLVDAIEANPGVVIPELAKRFGIKLDAGTVQQQSQRPEPKDGESALDFVERLTDWKLEQKLGQMQKQAPRQQAPTPIQAKVQATKQFLDKNHPDWAVFEAEMYDIVKERPAMIDRPSDLYAEARKAARQKATATKLGARSEQEGRIATGERGGSKVRLKVGAKGKNMSFNEAWELSKRQAKGLK